MTALVAPSLRVTAITSASRLSAAQWNTLVGRGAHLQAWFLAAEQCGWRARHVTVADGEATRLLVPAHVVVRADHDLHDRWLGPLRRLAAGLGVELRPILAVAAPFVQTSDPLGTLDGVPDAALERVFELLEEQGRQDGARAIVWPFLDPACDRIIHMARARGYAELYAGASAFLPIEWDSFADYVESRSKNVRRTIRADLRALETAGVRTDVTENFGPHADAVDALFRDFFRRRNGHASVLPARFFHDLSDQACSGITAQLTWDRDRLVGTSLNLTAARAIDGTFAACAPTYEGGPVYYNDLIYVPLRHAYGQGVQRLELGPTALYAKVLRGARLRRRVTLIRGATRALHALFRMWGRRVAARTDQKEHDLLAPLGGSRCFE